MSETRPFASLTSGLLARKGFARPAMRPQSHALVPPPGDDLGWNDMGLYGVTDQEPDDLATPKAPASSFLTPLPGAETAPPSAETPLPVVLRQQQEIEQEFGSVDAAGATTSEIAPGAPAKPVEQRANRRKKAAGASNGKAGRKPMPLPAPGSRAAPGSRGKAAFTLRLDSERHLRLRLACAIGHRSAQKLLIEALDAYLETVPGLDDLAESAASGPAVG